MNRSKRSIMGAAAAAVLVLSALVPGAMATAPAGAAVAGTTNLLPSYPTAGVTYLCGPNDGYACTPGYNGKNAPSWAQTRYGCPAASGCPDTPHNCQLWVAYKLGRLGVNPNFTSNPKDWDVDAVAKGYTVNQTPTVGAIAQWNAYNGHVAYVESVSPQGITLTMDWWSTAAQTPSWPRGYTAWIAISPGSPAWPDNFLHIKDLVGRVNVKVSDADRGLINQAADHFGIPREDALITGARLVRFLDALSPQGLGVLTPPVASAGPTTLTASYYDATEYSSMVLLALRSGLNLEQLHDLGVHLLVFLWYLDTH